ncbi:MAG: hypothetical protein KGL39_10760 [Patescibacteria group bacterium]|nr:hypothetical protein [Patescibacteria group bacterium]
MAMISGMVNGAVLEGRNVAFEITAELEHDESSEEALRCRLKTGRKIRIDIE